MVDPDGRTELEREVGVPGAVLLGLSSMVGTGIFVAIQLAVEQTGPWAVAAVLLAATLATLNGLSSAQLAASHPVSGGTYAYGYRYLSPRVGFAAGWLFLAAKATSAATAALGFSHYVSAMAGGGAPWVQTTLACSAVALLTLLAASGIRRSNQTNALVVGFSLAGLVLLIGFAGVRLAFFSPAPIPSKEVPFVAADFLEATALMFVAYTGYGRIATLGEEIRRPKKNIPRAILVTLGLTAFLYVAVTWVVVWADPGPGETPSELAVPLVRVARHLSVPGLSWVVSFGAVTAMLGVLLNLLLGLSRVVLAMARNGDMPHFLARVSPPESKGSTSIGCIGIRLCSDQMIPTS